MDHPFTSSSFARMARCLLLAAICALVVAPAYAEAKPWTLRSTFTLPYGNAEFEIDKGTAEWRLVSTDKFVLLGGAGFAIEHEDGTVWTNADFGEAEPGRDPFNIPLGEGSVFYSQFPPKDGVSLRYEVIKFSNRPFVMIHLILKNGSEKPLRIRSIRPVVFQPGGLGLISEGTQGVFRAMDHQGNQPVYCLSGSRQFVFFNHAARSLSLAMGMLPKGLSRTSLEFEPANGFWQGAANCSYAPGVEVAPGAEIATDMVWVAYGVEKPQDLDLYYAWVLSKRDETPASFAPIRAWVTVPEGEKLVQLVAHGREWLPQGVRHALIPLDWEARPGSMEGAAPRYPKRIDNAAGALRDAGLLPGITIDPLTHSGGSAPATARTSDGLEWINPMEPAGLKLIAEKVERLRKGGFEFIVAATSRIPDEALRVFGATRAQADAKAMEAMQAAAGDLPVYPQSRKLQLESCDAWLEAAAGMSRMARFGVKAGPLPLNTDAINQPGEDLLNALRIWPGPIEVHGLCQRGNRSAYATVFGRGVLAAVPVDFDAKSPRLWQLSSNNEKAGYLGSALLAFPGAAALSLSGISLENEGPHRFWQAENGAELTSFELPGVAGGAPVVIGASPVLDRPVLLGISRDSGLHLDKISVINWDEQEGQLSGKIEGPINEGAMAYVYVPETWKLTSARVGQSTVKKQVNGTTLALPITAGGATFDLQFKRQS